VGKLYAKTSWGEGVTKQIFIVKELYVADASLQHYGPPDSVWLSLEIR
jgi:hypothetical protein